MLAVAVAGSIACARASVAPQAASVAPREQAAPRSSALDPSELARATAWAYRAPPSCPGEGHFLEQLARRLPPSSAQDVAGAVGPLVDVEVHDAGGDWLGRVAFRAAEGPIVREVTGSGCDEVVVAMALITSLWIRPDGAPPSSGDRAQAAASGAASAPVSAERALVASAAPDESGLPPTLAKRASSESSPHSLEARALAPIAAPVEPDAASDASRAPPTSNDDASSPRFQIAGLLGYSSEPAGALAARLQLERWGSPDVSSWSTSFGFALAAGQHENDRLGPATLRMLSGQLELCPPGLDVSGAGWLRACAHGRVGALHFSAGTERVPNARSLWRPWAAAGAGVHAGVPLQASLSLRLLGEVSLVLTRDEFATERSPSAGALSAADVSTFYEMSPLSFDVGIGAAHVF